MAIPENITVVYNDDIPLEPRLDQDGLRITAGAAASAGVRLPGEAGDIMSFTVKGAFDVQFRFITSALGVANNKSELVFARTKELFLVPLLPCYLSVISPDGDSVVIVNTFKRGS